ncbi:MAG: Competence protein ComEA helix-hairpin-helix repeat protein [Thermotoga sp. 50_1627]|uniref:ComEA family DNA-binding protein n=1 Tax=Pseudothermotoga sp. TaxID=2033661 RepID=UPI00076BF945|nr:MAG: Competence protein ComEA helix-hairpin-helix repeat protein [Thermotoga sp. 50_64]KUK24679.1 MAG: Competence protein ComEA helix-hairpin-helix repeat protein [Thermotoga sp. 50_1627]MBC7115830.1 ComEA family DNA-binding protein [Pseudothermotoga sp.]MDK2923541.1 competence protein ComEA [Pseudothermotoga sp.]HBT38905.1 competence protein ComEA [Pseudothermotoga sp.]
MKLSTSEKRLLLLLFVGVLLLSGAIVELKARSGEQTIVETRKTVELPIDVNTASEEDLIHLPGIGETKARWIVEYREKNGPFKSLADLERVPGIGKKTVEMLAPYVNLTVADVVTAQGKINVNTASLEELMSLPGIGEVKASEIIKVRQQTRFSKPEDLLMVPGIGPKTLEKIKDFITF